MMKMLDNRTDDSAIIINTEVISFRVSPQHPHVHKSQTLKPKRAISDITQEATLPDETEYDFIVDFLNGFKPFAIRRKENNMPKTLDLSSQTPPPLPPPPPPRLIPVPDTTPKVKVPSSATRRAACTHLTMERLYGDFTCNICSRSSSFGWVYCCTQDEVPDTISETSSTPHQHVNGSNDKANSVSDLSMLPPAVDEDSSSGGEGTQMPTAHLSPWIERAIKDGHYTPEQIVELRAQKQHVVDTAMAAIHQFEESQTNNTDPPPQTPTTLPPVDTSPHPPLPVVKEVQEPATTGLPTAKLALAQHVKTKLFPFCKFCACQQCRPTHRDRAWQRFGDIFETEHEIPFVHYEDCNRPMASLSIMSTIGLRPPRLPQRPLLRSSDSRALYSRDEAGHMVFNYNKEPCRKPADPTSSPTDIADMDVETESKGFRESMKRAFKSMLMTREPSSRSNRRRRKTRGEGTDTPEADAVEFDMGLWKEMNDELLKEASDVPLPIKDSIEELRKKAAGKGVGGVSVTEEAADLGTADIIMSV